MEELLHLTGVNYNHFIKRVFLYKVDLVALKNSYPSLCLSQEKNQLVLTSPFEPHCPNNAMLD